MEFKKLKFKNGQIEGTVKLYYPNLNKVKYEGTKLPNKDEVSFIWYDEEGKLIGVRNKELKSLLKYFL